jgi:hypothetical protein
VIIAFLFNSLTTVLTFFLNPLPTGTTSSLTTAVSNLTSSSFWPDLGWANNYLPLDQAITALGLLLTLFAITYVVQVAIWVYHFFWGSN